MEKLQTIIIRQVIKLLSLIPARLIDRVAFVLGRLWYSVDPYHRKIADSNMENAFGNELTRYERQKLVKDNFVQLVRVALEIPSLLRLGKETINSFVRFEGVEHLQNALSMQKGVLFLSAHLGNWELMTTATALKFDMPIHAVVRPLDYTPMDRVLTEIRSRTGNIILNKKDSAAQVRQLLRENRVVGILLDQNASWYEGVYVPFFRKIACTNKGLALFARRYGSPVVPVFNLRQKDGRYKIIFEPAVSLVKTSDISNDIHENTIIFNRIIEKFIRMAPDNWFWVHRRWRIKAIPEKVRKKIPGIENIDPGFWADGQ